MQNLHSSARTAAKIMFKRWASLRQAKIATILMLAVAFSVGCNNEPKFFEPLKSEKITELPDQYGGTNTYNVIVLDSCEYIYCWFGAGNGGGSLTHKGNCKFCAFRPKNKKITK